MKKFNRIYATHKKKFPQNPALNTIHNVLWQVIVNKSFKGRKVAFSVAVTKQGNQIIFCENGKPGYYPTGVYFITSKYALAIKHCQQLNKEVFDLSRIGANRIVLSTMR